MSVFEKLTPQQKLFAALKTEIISICTQLCDSQELDISATAVDIITEVVYKKILTYGLDLEAFARHGKRLGINCDDVQLLVRRNPSLKKHIAVCSNKFLSASKNKPRKTLNKTDISRQNRTEASEAQSTTAIAPPAQKIAAVEENRLTSHVEEMDIQETIDLTED